jgi:hypothetical protein
MRWEFTRGLPVRRVPGMAKDAVFANPHDLDAWMQRSGNGAPQAHESETATTEMASPVVADAQTTAPAAAWWRSRRALLAVMALMVTAALLAVVAFKQRAAVAGGDGGRGAATATEPQTVEPTAHGAASAAVPGPPYPIVLALTVPGRATSKLGLALGKCGSQESESGNRVEFCVSAVGGRLAVTVTLLPKGAAMASPAQPRSTTYGLEPNARISVYEPVRVDIEWVSVDSVPPDAKAPDQP